MSDGELMRNAWGELIPASFFDKEICREALPSEVGSLGGGAGDGDARVLLFLRKIQTGDTLIWHSSPDADWRNHMGSEGYALIRNGYVVDHLIIRIN